MSTIATGIEKMQTLDASLCDREGQEMDAILARHRPSFLRNAFRYLGNAADAEDAVQDAMLLAYKHRDQFRRQARISTWLTAIVVNSARMQLRRRPRQTHVPISEEYGEQESYSFAERLSDRRPNPEEACRKMELAEQIAYFAAQLSPTLRRTFQMRDQDGLSIREVADILGVAEGTVKAQTARARAKLKRLMRKTLSGKHRQALGTDAPPVTPIRKLAQAE